MNRLIAIYVILLLLVSCHSNQPIQEQSDNYFENEEVGWSFNFPSDWPRPDLDEISRLNQLGKSSLEETLKDTIPNVATDLLWLKKDKFNLFTSAYQKFDRSTGQSYDESQKDLKEIIIDSYLQNGLVIDYQIGKIIIDGLKFNYLKTKVYQPNSKIIIATQIMYDRLIEEKILNFSITYSNEKNHKELLEIIETSKFTRRQ